MKECTPDSSFIKAFSWLKDLGLLVVVFHSESVWIYYPVPENVFDEMSEAKSTGKYFNDNVRDRYQSFKYSQNPFKDLNSNVQEA